MQIFFFVTSDCYDANDMPNIFTLKFKWTREMKEKSSEREQMEEINDLS